MREIPVSFFKHKSDAVPTKGLVSFPHGFDDFRDADARVYRRFLDDEEGRPLATDWGKNGRLWSPAEFNGRRSKANALRVHALVLDYDYTPPGREPLTAEEVTERWVEYEHVLHSTYTPGRWRVILPYSRPVTPAEHDAAYKWVLAREAGYLDGSVKDASRAFYWPTCRLDLDTEPVFGYNSGEPLDVVRLRVDLLPGPASGSPSSRIQSPLPNVAPKARSKGEVAADSGRVQTAPSRAREGAEGHGGGGAYSGIATVGQQESLPLIESRCAFMAHVRADATTLSEPEWYAALSIVARCAGGDDQAHALSAPYAGYDPDVTEAKYARAKGVGPATCAHIRGISRACAGCPLQVTSPVLLGQSAGGGPVGYSAVAGTPAPPAEPPPEEVAEDLTESLRLATEAYDAARVDEDRAIVGVEQAKRRLTLVRRALTSSDDDLTNAVTDVQQAREDLRSAERTRKARERERAAVAQRTSVAGLPPGADPATWQKLRLARDREGNVRPPPTLANLLVVLGDDPRWSSRISYDAFRLEVCWDREPLSEEMATWLTAQLSHDYGIDTATGLVLEAIRAVAKDREFHPVRDWLGELKWDGTERVRDLLLLGFGAKPEGDEDLVRLLGERFLLSLLARAYTPGEKVDTMLVLQGAQGSFKSTSFEVLVGKHWFSRSKMDLANKDAFMQLRGKWLFELAEMSAVRKVEDHLSKSFLSTDTDNYRAPYARRAEDHPRQVVFCGTTNEEEFLQDPTGWRRYWPVTVTRANLAWLREHRTQLFAEAMVLRAAGHQWWFDEGTPEAERLRVWAQPYRIVHPWTEHVRKWLSSPQASKDFTTVDVICGALAYAIGDVTRNDQIAMGAVLRDLACVRGGRRRQEGVHAQVYRRPEGMEVGRGASVTPLPRLTPALENNHAGG